MSEKVTINLDKASIHDARKALICITKYLNNARKEVAPKVYSGGEVFKNRHLLIEHAENIEALSRWIDQHEGKLG
ncbi:hypothetical protein N9954_02795 [Maribacter sp.]|nr:hypothetical protein [Maribacter sp.]